MMKKHKKIKIKDYRTLKLAQQEQKLKLVEKEVVLRTNYKVLKGKFTIRRIKSLVVERVSQAAGDSLLSDVLVTLTTGVISRIGTGSSNGNGSEKSKSGTSGNSGNSFIAMFFNTFFSILAAKIGPLISNYVQGQFKNKEQQKAEA